MYHVQIFTFSFPTQISAEFRSLAPVYRETIADICQRMGEGMTVYLEKSPDSMKDWDQVGEKVYISCNTDDTLNVWKCVKLAASHSPLPYSSGAISHCRALVHWLQFPLWYTPNGVTTFLVPSSSHVYSIYGS